MTTTYKKLSSYFLDRNFTKSIPSEAGSGYYYGGENVFSTQILEDDFNSIKKETTTISNFGEFAKTITRTERYNQVSSSLGFNRIASVYEQTDGKVILVGSFTDFDGDSNIRYIVRLNSDLEIDDSFNIPTLSSNINGLDVQDDGKILICGNFTTVNGTSRSRVARLNSDGTLDTSFSSPNPSAAPFNIQVMSDGKIFIMGNFSTVGGLGRAWIARLNSNGSVDGNFQASVSSGTVSKVLEISGGYLLAGAFTSLGGISKRGVAKVSTNGTLDQSFDLGLGLAEGVFTLASIRDIFLADNGWYYAGGSLQQANGVTTNIVKFNLSNTIDTSFSFPVVGNTNQVYVSSLTPTDSGIIVGGRFDNQTINGVKLQTMAKISYSDAAIDKSFVDNLFFGEATPNVQFVRKLGNNFVARGSFPFVNFLDNTKDGFTFTETGEVVDPNVTVAPGHVVWASAVQSDGSIYVGGSFEAANGKAAKNIAKLNNSGSSLDYNFNTTTNGHVFDIATQRDGKIIIGGQFTTVNDVTRKGVARLNSDGTLDTSFSPFNVDGSVRGIVVLPNGKIIIAGSFTAYDIFGNSRENLARLDGDGNLDLDFDQDANYQIFAIALQPDGKILIGGEFRTIGGVSRNRIARVNSDGTLDADFDPNSNLTVYALALQSDGKIVLGGNFSTVGGVARNNIARIDSYGNLDTTFNSIFDNDDAQADQIRTIFVNDDGKVLAGGQGVSVSGISDLYQHDGMVKLNEDGSLDYTFRLEAEGTKEFYTITYLGKNKFFIGGMFDKISGIQSINGSIIKEVVNNAPYKLVYTVPENTQTILKNIFVTNHNNFPVFYDIAVIPQNDANLGIQEKHHYIWDNLIDDNDYEKIESSITLSAGDEIYVYSSTDERLSFNIFGIEVS